jgi:DNA-binding GntR family transcriptional regulator
MTPEARRVDHLYKQISDHYRDQIRSGKLRNGDRFPTIRQIKSEWNVSHSAAVHAVSVLQSEGLITSRVGSSGTVVDVRDLGHSPRDRLRSIRRSGRIYPEGQRASAIVPEIVSAPDHVAAAMGIEPDAQVIRRYRVTCQGDVPVQASTSWMPGELIDACPLLLSPDRLPQGTVGYIAERTGRVVTSGSDEIGAMIADQASAEALAVDVGSALLTGRNWFRDASAGVIEFGEWISRPDHRQVYEYELD